MVGRHTHSRRRLFTTAGLAACAGLVTAVAPGTANAQAAWQIIDLGAGDNSVANAINEHGHIAGSYQVDGRRHAFLWRDGELVDLGALGGGSSEATGINNHDEVVGHSIVEGGATHAFVWRDGVMTDLGVLPGGDNSFARAINDDGEIVGWSATEPDNNGLHAVVWRDGVMSDLGGGPQNHSGANDINGRGVIVGWTGDHAVRWRGDAVQPLTDNPTRASAVNDRGVITGLDFSGSTSGFLWRQGTFIPIPPPTDAAFFEPSGINNHNQVVGHTDLDAVLWRAGRFTVLPALVRQASAHDINDHGQIVGASASTSNGLNDHAVLWTR